MRTNPAHPFSRTCSSTEKSPGTFLQLFIPPALASWERPVAKARRINSASGVPVRNPLLRVSPFPGARERVRFLGGGGRPALCESVFGKRCSETFFLGSGRKKGGRPATAG